MHGMLYAHMFATPRLDNEHVAFKIDKICVVAQLRKLGISQY